jgi:hypothetical protein
VLQISEATDVKIRNVMAIACLTGIILVVVFCLNLNTVIKIAIKQTLTQSLAVETTLMEVTFNPLNGYLRLKGFEVDNPNGFSTSEFLQVRDFVIQIQPNTLLGDRIEIEKIQLQDISINIEQQLTRNNIQEIFISAGQYKQSDRAGTAAPEKKFNLQSATIDNISINLNLSPLGLGSLSSADYLPKIELQNLNSENYQGLLMSEVFTKLIASTVENIVEKNKLSIPKQILQALTHLRA